MKKIDLGQLLWQLTMATQDIERLSVEELFEAYKQAYAAHHYSLEDGVSETERRWALKLFEDIEFEMKRRHLTIIAAFVSMDPEGHFICGREDLKKIFTGMSFDEMVELGDEMLSDCENEAQRNAIIELEREVAVMVN